MSGMIGGQIRQPVEIYIPLVNCPIKCARNGWMPYQTELVISFHTPFSSLDRLANNLSLTYTYNTHVVLFYLQRSKGKLQNQYKLVYLLNIYVSIPNQNLYFLQFLLPYLDQEFDVWHGSGPYQQLLLLVKMSTMHIMWMELYQLSPPQQI